MNQLESTIDTLKERTGDAVDAVHHGVETLTSKLSGLVEPEPKRRRGSWTLIVVCAVAGAALAWWLVRRSRSDNANEQRGAEAQRTSAGKKTATG